MACDASRIMDRLKLESALIAIVRKFGMLKRVEEERIDNH
jgi:hypothetical protein